MVSGHISGTGLSRRKFLACCGGALCASLPISAQSQEKVPAGALNAACSWNAEPPTGDAWLFQSSDLAKKIMGEVVKAVGLRAAAFEIHAGSVPNAAAYIDSKTFKRMIVYSETWAQRTFGSGGDSYWMGIALLSHECAHHFNNDTLELLKPNLTVNAFAASATETHRKELAADEFAGFVVGRMKGSLQQAQDLFSTLPETATGSHPARSVRLEAVTVGWQRGNGEARNSEACQPDWVGPQFKAHGVDCRQIRLCKSAKPKMAVACRDSTSNKWFYE
jgi:hypothetical protein